MPFSLLKNPVSSILGRNDNNEDKLEEDEGKSSSMSSSTSVNIVNMLSHGEDILYKINSMECFENLAYQRKCINELLNKVFPEDDGLSNVEEVARLLTALSLQAPDLKLPIPAGFFPLIRFDFEKVPYFHFQFITPHLPLLQGLDGPSFFSKTADDLIIRNSKVIFDEMIIAHFQWSALQNINNNIIHEETASFAEEASVDLTPPVVKRGRRRPRKQVLESPVQVKRKSVGRPKNKNTTANASALTDDEKKKKKLKKLEKELEWNLSLTPARPKNARLSLNLPQDNSFTSTDSFVRRRTRLSLNLPQQDSFFIKRCVN